MKIVFVLIKIVKNEKIIKNQIRSQESCLNEKWQTFIKNKVLVNRNFNEEKKKNDNNNYNNNGK